MLRSNSWLSFVPTSMSFLILRRVRSGLSTPLSLKSKSSFSRKRRASSFNPFGETFFRAAYSAGSKESMEVKEDIFLMAFSAAVRMFFLGWTAVRSAAVLRVSPRMALRSLKSSSVARGGRFAARRSADIRASFFLADRNAASVFFETAFAVRKSNFENDLCGIDERISSHSTKDKRFFLKPGTKAACRVVKDRVHLRINKRLYI